LGSRWWPLSLATRPNQPPFHGPSNQIPSSHHSSHSRFFCNYDLSPLSRLLSCNSPKATQVKMLILKFDFDFIEKFARSGN
jgi:hypothetical protein